MSFDYGIDLETLEYSTQASFDYGTEEALPEHRENTFKYWPSTGNATLLLDADSIPYIVGFTVDEQEWCEAQRHPMGPEYSEFARNKREHADWLVNEWMRKADADSVLLYVTDSASNFRLKLASFYKEQRVEKPKPPLFDEIKSYLVEAYGATWSNGCEADDEISIEAWRRHKAFDGDLWGFTHKAWSDFIIGSMDKDLNIVTGWHVDWGTGIKYWVQGTGELQPKWKDKDITAYEYHPLFDGDTIPLDHCVTSDGAPASDLRLSDDDKWSMEYVWHSESKVQDTYSRGKNKGKGKFKRVKIGTKKSSYISKLGGTGLSFFYSQILTGDPTDNYKGLEGCGPTKAYELLEHCSSEEELFEVVFSEYEKRYGECALEELTLQGQMAWMQTERGELWQPPVKSKRQSYPL